ncbi:metallophosphoesterase family protein [Methanotorris igneus]|uniref:Metallophosphoesterase n=1 Tax=Methanotorris igneus (strain DSM 5666 / JCM 11834 / Kol 5) TaxID=880724 RepID=F6BAC3_METIK|nr:metallophosphoesterase family protein [Methanotorris igneus]AEF95813.1 metallophosphoesterase [Methanotorris igneus Kol 5]
MKLAILSDIHSNLEALEAVLNDIDKHDIDRVFCLGDIVGYGANPNECIEIIKKFPTVAGNHDYGVIGKEMISFFNTFGQIAIIYTKEVLKEENAEYLKKLPLIIEEKIDGKKVIFSHACPQNPDSWEYLFPDYVPDYVFSYEDVVFVGHSHIPFVYSKNRGCVLTHEGKIELNENDKYVINPGSVGQPRDGVNRASYAIFDTDEYSVEIKRIPYDIIKAANKILNVGLPEYLAERLFLGK